MKNYITSTISILFIIFLNITNAQTFTNYTTANGLPDNYVTSVVIDTNNNKWFGTSAGVAKYNDTLWKTYSTTDGLIDNYINCIAVDKSNNIWVGTNNGVSKFNGSTWISYTTTNGLIDNTVYYIASDIDSSVWFATYSGASHFKGSVWTNFTTTNGLPSNTIDFIKVDSIGNKWFGTQLGGIAIYDNTSFTIFSTSNIDSLLDNNIFTIAFDHQGNKWIGTWYGMSELNSSNSWTANFRKGNGLYNNFLRDITIDSKGNIWIGMYADYNHEGGLTRYNSTNWASYTVNEGLINAQVLRIATDKENNLWIATGGGVSKLSGATGIKNISENISINVYPNPANEILNIKFNETTKNNNHNIELYNIYSQKINEFVIPSGTKNFHIPLDNYTEGIYILKIGYFTQKLIINKTSKIN